MKRVLVACDMIPSFLEGLQKQKFKVDYMPNASNNEVFSIIENYNGIVISTRIKMDREKIDEGKKLKFIARAGSGMENIDTQYAQFKNIVCVNSPEGNSNAVGEHALGMLLTLFNNINRANVEVRKGKWLREENRGIEIAGKTVGIFGYGHTGSSFAEKLKGFDCKILAYDKYKKGFGNKYVNESSLNEIYKKADIISFHLPLTEETGYMVNSFFLNNFSKNIYLINTSRGKIIKTEDLVQALEEGKVLGACLDVLEDEQITPQSLDMLNWLKKLTLMPNIILTPHIAGWTYQSKEKIGQILLRKITLMSSES